jgi:exosortase/archaeosortase family protein
MTRPKAAFGWGWAFSALVLGALPLVEFLALRQFYHSTLGLRLGWPSMADRDYYLPAATGLFFFCYLMRYGSSLAMSFRLKGLLFHFVVLFCFVVFSIAAAFGLFALESPARFIWWVLCLLSFGSTVTVWLNPRSFLSPKFLPVSIACVLIALANAIHMSLAPDLGRLLVQVIGRQTCTLTQWTLGDSVTCVMSSHGITLRHPHLMFIIGRGCAGIDGLLFSVLSLSAYFAARRTGTTLSSKIVFYGLNLAMFYLLNLLRIQLIAALAIVSQSRDIAFGLFHYHLGWVLYAAAQITFLSVFERFGLGSLSYPILRVPSKIRYALGGGLLLVCLALFSLYHRAALAACSTEICVTRVECDANSGDGNYSSCKGCTYYSSSECLGCADLVASGGDECDKPVTGNDAVCNWTGSACEDIPTVPELPTAWRGLFLLAGAILPMFPYLRARRRKSCHA